jgi:hypothetical protein
MTLATPGQRSIIRGFHALAFFSILLLGWASAALGQATHFQVVAPGTATAGSSFLFTVKALDVGNAVVTGYAGTVHFSSADPLATLPGDATLINGTGAFSATLNTGGTQFVGAEEVGNASINGQSGPIVVAAGAHFVVVAPANATAGSPFTFTVQSIDQFFNIAPNYSNIVHFTSSDSLAVLPADTLITGGFGTFTATLGTGGGPFKITATEAGNVGITGDSGPIIVAAGAHFVVVAPANATAGSPFTFTVQSIDQFFNIAPNYSNIVHFTASDLLAGLPADTLITGGFGTFTATLRTGGGPFKITATEAGNVGITGDSGPIIVAAGAHFAVVAPALVTANVPFTFTVQSIDQFFNIAPNYSNIVHFTSSDLLSVLPADTLITGGFGTFTATLRTGGGPFKITATEAGNVGITGDSGPITVTPATVTHFTVSAPASATAGSAFSFTVTALDATNATVTSYAGIVHFTSSDGQAVLPANATLTSGVGTFSATLKTAGNQTITATDTVTASITGTSIVIAVSAAAATHYSVSAPANASGGVALNFTATALDQFNNTATGYAGTVHFTSSDGAAVLPANSTLTNGVGTFSATLNTAGSRTITATDTVSAAITGTSSAITVGAAAVTSFTGPSATGTGNITASFTGGGAGCTFVTAQFIPVTGAPSSPPAGTAPAGVVFPHGLFDFATTGCTPGSTLGFTITYPAALSAGTQYWKYGPRTGQPAAWYVLPATIAGATATFSITDGGLGDDDLAANGAIVDQGGPGSGGALVAPTLSEWAIVLLAMMLMGFALRSLHKAPDRI